MTAFRTDSYPAARLQLAGSSRLLGPGYLTLNRISVWNRAVESRI